MKRIRIVYQTNVTSSHASAIKQYANIRAILNCHILQINLSEPSVIPILEILSDREYMAGIKEKLQYVASFT